MFDNECVSNRPNGHCVNVLTVFPALEVHTWTLSPTNFFRIPVQWTPYVCGIPVFGTHLSCRIPRYPSGVGMVSFLEQPNALKWNFKGFEMLTVRTARFHWLLDLIATVHQCVSFPNSDKLKIILPSQCFQLKFLVIDDASITQHGQDSKTNSLIEGFSGKRALGFFLKIELCRKRSKLRMQFCLGALNNVLYVFVLKFSSFARYYVHVCKKACICGLISTWPERR